MLKARWFGAPQRWQQGYLDCLASEMPCERLGIVVDAESLAWWLAP